MRTLRKVTISSLLLATAFACAVDRPSRNGVFNENQYVRKDFLISKLNPDGSAATDDPGWLFRATVMETSTPNMMGAAGGFDVWGGLQGTVDWVRFVVTQDKLQMVSMRQFSNPSNRDGNPDDTSVTPNVVNAWPVTNVDLKYRVNLDGERTNFYEENQELNWQQRQWVKINFAKNDFSDFAPLGVYVTDLANKCADIGDASATLVTDSLVIEKDASNTSNDYFEFTVSVSVPLKVDDPACIAAYGSMLDNAARLERTQVTVNLKYSFRRATPQANLTYTPWQLDEKDPIHRKYGPFLWTVFNRDPVSQLVAATQFVGRFDPAKPIVFYFDKNFPTAYKDIFSGQNGIKDATNALLAQSGAAAQVDFKDYNDGGTERRYGDIRYNFLRWASDQDLQDSFAGVTMPGFDPRTGEIVNESIEFNDFAVRDYYVQRIDAFLVSIGASEGVTKSCKSGADCASGNCGSDGFCEWATLGSCTSGDTLPLVTQNVISDHNAKSTLFTKMQQYLHVHGPDPKNDHIGPQDLIYKQDDDFRRAYYGMIPYQLFADPDMNLFVTREGGAGVYGPAGVWQHLQDEANFHDLARKIDQGQAPFTSVEGPDGIANALNFANNFRTLTGSHMEFERMKMFVHGTERRDSPDAFSLEAVMLKDGRRCINGAWETKESWIQGIIDAYWQQVFWHEFGHAMGMEHNFMASVDKPNFPDPTTDSRGVTHYGLYSSSVMEYNAAPDRLFWTPGWGKYDQGAITWIYANNGKQPADPQKDAQLAMKVPLSGQLDATYPYVDKAGFDSSGNERQFLRCDENHLRYSPLCRQGDMGTTPSEIIANAIDMYEWQYPWRNFRNYRKVWNNAFYADGVVGTITDMHRFLSLWAFDWGGGEIATLLYRIGITPPAGAPSAQDYYAQLTQKFNSEVSQTNQVIAAFHKALIQQASGERPFATVYDPFYGDEKQQGIILDKYFAMQNWVGLWPSDNYDQNQAGAYISSWGDFGELSYASVAEDTVTSMIGSQYAVYPYFIPTAVALFAQDTHNPAFSGRIEARDWIGGQVFWREQDLIDYFKNIAVAAGGPPAASGLPRCTSFTTCAYNVTDPTQTKADPTTNVFVGPDQLTYVYAYVPGRNAYVVARKDRNIATFKIVHDYNVDILGNHDDGSNGAYGLELPIKYTIDAYKMFD
jgi:hypothetical protein